MVISASGISGNRFIINLAVFLFFVFIISLVPQGLSANSLYYYNNTVRLGWTATGDDGKFGRASYYDIRYSTDPIGSDTAGWWQKAVQVIGEPTPAPSGQRNSCFISDLDIYEHYYFAIKVADEVYNWSEISVVAELPEVYCGDVNGDLALNYLDIVYILNHIYQGGPPPVAPASGDVDDSGELNVADTIYLLNFILNSGPPPVCGQ